MAEGVKGFFDIAGTGTYNWITGRVFYEETYDPLANTSQVTITDLQFKSSNWYWYEYFLNGTVSINGAVVAKPNSALGNLRVYITAQNKFFSVGNPLAPPWTSGTIAHNTDGSKSIEISLDVRGWNNSGAGGSGWRVAGGQTVALTTIPRASEIKAADAAIGSVSMIAVNRKSTAYTHSIEYWFGTLAGYVTESGGVSPTEVKMTATSIPWTVPTEFYTQITNAQTGWGELHCRTYSGSTQVGDMTTARFNALTREETCRPEVSGTVTDGNSATAGLTGDENNVLVRYMSTAVCTISATAKNGASIVSKTIGGVGIGVKENTRSIPAVETGSFTFSATDSRGYSYTPDPVKKTLIPYVKLTNNASATRNGSLSGDARLSLSGDYYSGGFGAVDNTLTAKYRITGVDSNWNTVTPAVTGNRYSLFVPLSGLDYKQPFNIEVWVEDKLAVVNKSIVLEAADPSFYWGKDSFTFGIPVAMNEGLRGLYYHSNVDQTEENFEAYLTGAIEQIRPWDILVPIQFCVYPAVSGNAFYGFLGFSHAKKWGGILGWSYNGHMVHKELRDGVWQPTQLKPYDRDYVLESGTSGVWTYRKWASGAAECWCAQKVTLQFPSNPNWGSMYSTGGSSIQRLNYPFAFKGTPVCVAQVSFKGGNCWLVTGDFAGSNTQTPCYQILRPTAWPGDFSTVVNYQVRGNWK